MHEPSLNTNIGGLVPSRSVQYIYYSHPFLYITQCTYGESHREGCVRVPRSAPRVTSDTGCTAQLQRCVPAGPCLQWEWDHGGWDVRDALQPLEIREVSQRGGQGGDALVGEVVVAQAARARGRGADPKGGQPAPGVNHSERGRGRGTVCRHTLPTVHYTPYMQYMAQFTGRGGGVTSICRTE